MTDEYGRGFVYLCHHCGEAVESCPDPACREEGVGHHIDDNGECPFGSVRLDLCGDWYFDVVRRPSEAIER